MFFTLPCWFFINAMLVALWVWYFWHKNDDLNNDQEAGMGLSAVLILASYAALIGTAHQVFTRFFATIRRPE